MATTDNPQDLSLAPAYRSMLKDEDEATSAASAAAKVERASELAGAAKDLSLAAAFRSMIPDDQRTTVPAWLNLEGLGITDDQVADSEGAAVMAENMLRHFFPLALRVVSIRAMWLDRTIREYVDSDNVFEALQGAVCHDRTVAAISAIAELARLCVDETDPKVSDVEGYVRRAVEAGQLRRETFGPYQSPLDAARRADQVNRAVGLSD